MQFAAAGILHRLWGVIQHKAFKRAQLSGMTRRLQL